MSIFHVALIGVAGMAACAAYYFFQWLRTRNGKTLGRAILSVGMMSNVASVAFTSAHLALRLALAYQVAAVLLSIPLIVIAIYLTSNRAGPSARP
jgi:hypothetical protein